MRKDLSQTTTCEPEQEAKQEVGLLTYLVVDLRSGLQGLGGAFFILLCDPRSLTDRCST
jgi:hypothetical protein